MQAMKTVTLDAHTERSQMAVISEHGEILIELQVETTPEKLRRVVSGITGPKRVVLESGPLSASSGASCDFSVTSMVLTEGRTDSFTSRRIPAQQP
jgi:hypothetical protein